MKKRLTFKNALKDKRGFAERRKLNTRNQLKTMATLKRLDRNIFLLDCSHDYALDDLLEEGCGSIIEMVDFAARRFFYGAGTVNIAEPEMGCSVFTARNEKGEHIMGRNFDYKNAPCMIVRTTPENGYRSLSVVDTNFMLWGFSSTPEKKDKALGSLLAPYLCVDGINEKGVAIAVLELKSKPTKQSTGKKPIATTTIIRAVLDKAANVDEAIELFRKYDMHDVGGVAYHFAVSDSEGKAVLVEYVDNVMQLFYPESLGDGDVENLIVTNHFISPDGPDVRGDGGERRTKAMKLTLKENNGVISQSEAMKLLSRLQLHYYHALGWPVRTLWSAVYNNDALTMDIVAGQDYKTVYSFNVLQDEKFNK